MPRLPSNANAALRLKPLRKQAGFVVENISGPAETSGAQYSQAEPPASLRYEPLYVLSYGSPGTPASEGHWCAVMADDAQSASGTRNFSLHGLCRAGRATTQPVSPTPSTSGPPGRKRRVTFLEPDFPARRESQRRRTYPDSTATSILGASSSRYIPITSDNVPDEVRKAPLRSMGHPIDYALKNSTSVADCVQENSPSLPSHNAYKFEGGDQKVLGVVEIAQLPLNLDAAKKRHVLNRIRMDLWNGNMREKDLDDARREWVVRVVNDLTGEWKTGCKDLPIGAKATVQNIAKLFDSLPSKA